MAESTLSRWKDGEINPDLATLVRLANALRLPLPALLTDEPAVPKKKVDEVRQKLAEAQAILGEDTAAAVKGARSLRTERKGRRRPSRTRGGSGAG